MENPISTSSSQRVSALPFLGALCMEIAGSAIRLRKQLINNVQVAWCDAMTATRLHKDGEAVLKLVQINQLPEDQRAAALEAAVQSGEIEPCWRDSEMATDLAAITAVLSFTDRSTPAPESRP